MSTHGTCTYTGAYACRLQQKRLQLHRTPYTHDERVCTLWRAPHAHCHTGTRRPGHAEARAAINAQRLRNACARTLTHTDTDTDANTHTHTHTLCDTHTQTKTHTHTHRMHAHVHTRTHKYTQSISDMGYTLTRLSHPRTPTSLLDNICDHKC